jgi:hypothetical protein
MLQETPFITMSAATRKDYNWLVVVLVLLDFQMVISTGSSVSVGGNMYPKHNGGASSPISAVTEPTFAFHSQHSVATNNTTDTVNKGGRPKGSTMAAKIAREKNINLALEWAATDIINHGLFVLVYRMALTCGK